MERRLAAVMISDLAGYGHLIQADEEGTRARLQADLHEVFEPSIATHRGRLVKTMGDGLLVEFYSVVDALRCAVEVQRAKAERDADVPVDRRLEFRIGINLGDLIVEGDDIHGEGVIIADRLQYLADKGGIVISGTAYDQVKAKVPVGFAFLGEQPIKHIAEPVRVYRVLPDAAGSKTIATPAPALRQWKLGRLSAAAAVVAAIGVGVVLWFIVPPSPPPSPPGQRTIAVMPFANLGGDPTQDYFADGMTDDLITELSMVSGLFVISRNSTFVYNGKTVSPKQVSEELDVQYVVEGSVQRAGEQLRINVRVIDTRGGPGWADHFTGSQADVFALQDKVARGIADAVAVTLTPDEWSRMEQQETAVPAAYDAFLRGWELFRNPSPENYKSAIANLETAVKLDPAYGRAYAALALIYWSTNANGWNTGVGVSSAKAASLTAELLTEANKHPTATAHQIAGNLLRASGRYDEAFAQFGKAIELDPNDSLNYAYMARGLTFAGRPEDALRYVTTATKLDPHAPVLILFQRGLAQFGLERFADAARSFEDAAKLAPDNEFPFLLLGATYGRLGRTADAHAAIATYDALRTQHGGTTATIGGQQAFWGFKNSRDLERLLTGLRAAGVPE